MADSKHRSARIGILLLAAFAAVAAATAMAQSGSVRYRDPVFTRVRRTTDLVYGRATDLPSGEVVDLRLDLYEPEGDPELARPVLLFIHGGGFVGGDKASVQRWGLEFARRGWVVAAIGYRLNQSPSPEVRISAAVQDARQAMRWLAREAATYRLDVGRMVVGGGSAGAITALFLTYTDMDTTPADVSVRVAGVMDLWGALPGRESEMTAGEPPLIIVHGTEDTVVPYRYAEALRDRAEAVGIPYAFHPLVGVGHGSGETAQVSAWTAEFFYPLLWPEASLTPTARLTATAPTPSETITAVTPAPSTATPSPTRTPVGNDTRQPTAVPPPTQIVPGGGGLFLPLLFAGSLQAGPMLPSLSLPTVPRACPTAAGPVPPGW